MTIALQSKGHGGYDKKNSEKINIENCFFWTDRANIFRLGYESETGAMQDISAKNIDVLHFVDNRPPEDFWANCVFYIQPSDNMPMSRIRFEDIRINASDGNDSDSENDANDLQRHGKPGKYMGNRKI